ncbi:MAG: hypothetical protein CL608_29695 [Anaerolineaceae bacterium]|nr:hypothetical protein [Anaerolineaceae bacterium]
MNEKSKARWFASSWAGLLAILFIALAAAWPELAQPGLLNTRGGGDSPFLLQRLHQLETAVLDGHFPVRWMPDANYGYGYPFYNYYAPLSIYITFFFRLLGFSFVRAIHLSHLLGYVVAAWGTFALARRWFGSRWAGLLAAVAYTVAPFHLVNVYVRGDSLAEFWAMAFYPLVILAADDLFGGGRRQMALFALAYAALILSHNISALIFSPFLLLYLLLRFLFLPRRARRAQRSETQLQSFDSAQDKSPISNLLSALILALALAAWFFVPALAEQSLAQLDTVTSGYFHYSNHFLGTAEFPLTQSTFFVDYSVVDREAFRMGLVQTAVILTSLLALLWLWFKQRQKMIIPAIFIGLTMVVSSFMLTPLSAPLWEHLPLLAFTQFPWRFLSVQAFGGALAVGALALVIPRPQWWTLPLIVLLLASSLGQLNPDHLPLTDADVTAESLAQYEWFTGNIGTTISFEYLPPTVQPRPYTSSWLNRGDRWTVTPLAGELVSAALLAERADWQRWSVETAVPSTLIFPILHWPGWRAEIDGETVGIRPSAGSGLIELDVPAGEHEIELRLGRTPVRLAAEVASLLAILLTIWLFQPSKRWLNRKTGFAVVGLLLLAIVVRLWPEPMLPRDLHTWDFVQMGYLHSESEGVTFVSGVTLQAAAVPAEIQAGETLRIELEWDSPPAQEVRLELFFPAINWPVEPGLSPPTIAQQTVPGNITSTVFELTLPENAPAGLFVPRLTLADNNPLTPAGRSRNALFLQPIRVLPVANDLPESEQLTVRGIDVQQTSDGQLTVQLAWFTPQPLSHNYNVALRLTDAQGRFVRVVDIQPGYGFLPSSGWPAGQWVHDWLTIPLPPPEESHERPFALVAQLYDVTKPNTAVLTRRLGELVEAESGLVFQPTEPVFVLPEGIVRETAVFGDEIELQGYQFSQTNEALNLMLVWQALANGRTDYTRFVHLIELDGSPLVQSDSPPRYGSYPTSQWTAGEVVSDTITLPLADVPPGNYRLAVGFYSQPVTGQFDRLPVTGQFDRLPVQNGAGEMVADGRFILPITVNVEP